MTKFKELEEHVEALKEYIKSRKRTMHGELAAYLSAGKTAEVDCMYVRIKEVEAMEAKLYGGVAFVPEEELAEKLIPLEKDDETAEKNSVEIPIE